MEYDDGLVQVPDEHAIRCGFGGCGRDGVCAPPAAPCRPLVARFDPYAGGGVPRSTGTVRFQGRRGTVQAVAVRGAFYTKTKSILFLKKIFIKSIKQPL